MIIVEASLTKNILDNPLDKSFGGIPVGSGDYTPYNRGVTCFEIIGLR